MDCHLKPRGRRSGLPRQAALGDGRSDLPLRPTDAHASNATFVSSGIVAKDELVGGELESISKWRDLAQPSAVDRGTRSSHRLSRHGSVFVIVGACVPALLYLIYVFHYSVDVPDADDWDAIGFVASALHGHLTIGALWGQYVAGRPFFPRLVLLAFGLVDHLNEKSITLLSATAFITAFGLLLLSFRNYIGRRLAFLQVFSLGLVWFSLADLENALWASQLAAYIVVLLFAAMMYFLFIPRRRRHLFFALGIVAAIVASLTYLQGFLLWPVGLVCLLWAGPRGRRTLWEVAIWISSAAILVAIYFHGYVSADATCLAEGGNRAVCSPGYGVLHPVLLVRYVLVLVGNVVPTSLTSISPGQLRECELIGSVVCVVSIFVLIQSIRERHVRKVPLPMLLIVFALLFDLMIAQGHLGEGLSSAGIDRFPMPNIILLVGILMYVWGHLPDWRDMRWNHGPRRGRLTFLGFSVLMALVVAQCAETTYFGISQGSAFRAANVRTARVVVNLDRIPSARRACYFESTVVGPPLFDLQVWLGLAERNRLSVFQRSTWRVYRAEGPPTIVQCDQKFPVGPAE